MPVERDGLTSTKNRPLPVDPDAVTVKWPEGEALLQEVRRELTAIRMILAEALSLPIDPDQIL